MATRRSHQPMEGDQVLPFADDVVAAATPPAVPAPPPVRRARRKPGLTPEQRALRSRLAAYQLHATHDPKETTKKARAAFAARFEREVDPDGVLSPDERARRAEAARRAYFTRLALRSSQARRKAG